MINITTEQLLDLTSRGVIWDLGNEMLYKLCRDYPDHKSPEVIVAKVWLIGRSYAAAIERGREMREDGDTFYESKVVPEIQASDLDKYLEQIKPFEDITDDNIPIILKTHKYLTDVFAKITGNDKRSLASKYLHFHRPSLFFLYDSRAARGAQILCPRFKPKITIKEFDAKYAKFFLKLNYLRGKIQKEQKRLLQPRQIDNILINIGSL